MNYFSGNQDSTMPDQKGPCGLINQGMTCYLNSVLQMLFMTDEFRDHVLSSPLKENLLKALADLFRRLQEEQTAVSTRQVMNALNITNVHEQQDAAQYLQMILHRVPEPSEIFRGIMVTSNVCLCCKHNKTQETEFLSIPLSIDAKGKCDVEYALMEYMGIHEMKGEDQLYCVKCESMKDMETRNSIKKWPDILTLQLKRFEMAATRTGYEYWKNECRVKIQVGLGKHESSPKYELYGIINHYGTYHRGHYDTVIKDESGNWYHFNDHTVKKLNCRVNQWINEWSSSAYLLVYRNEEATSGQTKGQACRPQTCTNDSRRSNSTHHVTEMLANSEKKDNESRNNVKSNVSKIQEHANIKPKQDMKGTNISIENRSSESLSKNFKLRLKEVVQYLRRHTSPGETQKLNDVYTEPHFKQEPNFRISDNREIMRNNIFERQKIRTVLMKGEAGIGKTVTVQKFILDWAEEKSNQDIKYIFLIPFQKLNIIRETVKECSFMELLQRCFENTEHEKPTDSDRIMLIFDGLNEFKLSLDFKNTKLITDINDPASVTDLLINLIKGNLLPNAQIWITSRPAAANQIPAEYIDRVTEIQGFNEEQKEQYFRKNISDQMKANEVISHIRKSRRINSMCFLPDYCRIIAEIPEEMFRTGRSDFPKTLTQMYGRLLLAQMKLNRDNKETIKALAKIAFDLLMNGSSRFCDEDLKKYAISVGSVKANSSIIKVTESKSNCKSFCFVNHRTQEFLAALYVTDVINRGNALHLRDINSLKLEFGEQSFTYYNSLQNMMNIALQKQMDLFFCFLLGLTLESSQRDLKDLLTQRRRSSSSSQEIIQHIKTMIMNSSPDDADKRNLLFDALKELDERYLIQQMKASLKSGLRVSSAQFSYQSFHIPISSLMIEFLNSEDYLDQFKSHVPEEHHLNLQPVVRTSGKHEVYQCEVGVEFCAVLRSNLSHLRELDLSENNITYSGMKQLSDLLKDPQCKLEKLRLRACDISDEYFADLSLALISNPFHLRELDLSNSYIKYSGVKQLSTLLRNPLFTLEKLGLKHCYINEITWNFLSSALSSNPSHLRELDLSENYITDSGVKQLSDLLEDPQCKLEKLRLRSCHISDGGCANLSSALRSNPSHLRELDLSDNCITDSEVKLLSDLLTDPKCKLEKLGLKLGTVKYAVLRTNTIRVNWSETADLVTGLKNLTLNN